MSNNTTIENEFRYIIPRSKLNEEIPRIINDFKLIESYSLELEDILFEREKISLKNEKIGIRARKNGCNYELTYKKFLGKKNGAAQFLEKTIHISNLDYTNIRNLEISYSKFPMLNNLQETGNLYVLATINNRRRVHIYKNDYAELELAVEDLTYVHKGDTVTDAMIELEIKYSKSSPESNFKDIASVLKQLFDGSDTDDGKNSRAMKLLNLTA